MKFQSKINICRMASRDQLPDKVFILHTLLESTLLASAGLLFSHSPTPPTCQPPMCSNKKHFHVINIATIFLLLMFVTYHKQICSHFTDFVILVHNNAISGLQNHSFTGSFNYIYIYIYIYMYIDVSMASQSSFSRSLLAASRRLANCQN